MLTIIHRCLSFSGNPTEALISPPGLYQALGSESLPVKERAWRLCWVFKIVELGLSWQGNRAEIPPGGRGMKTAWYRSVN